MWHRDVGAALAILLVGLFDIACPEEMPSAWKRARESWLREQKRRLNETAAIDAPADSMSIDQDQVRHAREQRVRGGTGSGVGTLQFALAAARPCAHTTPSQPSH